MSSNNKYYEPNEDATESKIETINCTQPLNDSRHGDSDDAATKDVPALNDVPDIDVIREPHTSTTFKWVKTICLYLGFVSLGLIETLIGPTMLDLKEQVGVDTAQISAVFSTYSIGCMLGCTLGGYLIDRFNQPLIISFTLLLGGIFAIVTPWFYNFGPLAVFLGLLGIASGTLDTSGNVILMLIWGLKSDPFFQFLHFAFGVGATITPLMAQPFISQEIKGTVHTTTILSNSTYWTFNTTDSENDTSEVVLGRTESRIQYIYLIVGLYNVIIGISFFVITAFGKRTIHSLKYETDENHEETYGKMTLKYKIQMLMVLFLLYFLYCGMEMSTGGLVMIFSIEGLGWPKHLGPIITSAFWGAIMVSRILGVFATKILSLTQMIAIDMLVTLLSFLVMVIFVNSHYIVLWVTMATAGVGMGSVFASMLSWYQHNVMPVTGYVACTTLVAAAISGITVPLLTGYIIDKINYMGFPYMMLALQIGLCFVAGSVYISVRLRKKASVKENDARKNVEEIEMMIADRK